MAYYFTNRVSQHDIHNILLRSFGAELKAEDMQRLQRYQNNWNFYEGYHWETIPQTDKPQVTLNYCRAFVNKFVAFEMGKGFNIKMKPEIESIDNDNDPLDFLNNVWEDNRKLEKLLEIGQSKSVTGDSWLQILFEPKYDANGKRRPEFKDPFNEYEKGMIRLIVVPSSIVFPEYDDGYDKDKMKKLIIMYPVTEKEEGFFGVSKKSRTVLYRQVWTDERVQIFVGDEKLADLPNKYGVIPFVHFKNFILAGRNFGISDLEDIIPINMEINLKSSDISEIIDYHSAPVTVVFGARIGQLERGANKVWGGLPKDARIENLRLEGDLTAAQNYIHSLKLAMHEIGSIPEGALGASQPISNTSGVALEITLMPLMERIRLKQVLTKEALEYANKIILLIGITEGLIKIPDGINRRDFFYNEVTFDNPLPKDGLLELQEIELEMRMGLESREDAMKRLGKSNIQEKIKNIDEDREKNPTIYGLEDVQKQIELMEAQMKTEGKVTTPPSTVEKKVGENKEGKPKKINSGYGNSPNPKPKTE